MGEAKRKAAAARVNARQNAIGWDANGSPEVDFPPVANLYQAPKTDFVRSPRVSNVVLALLALSGERMVVR